VAWSNSSCAFRWWKAALSFGAFSIPASLRRCRRGLVLRRTFFDPQEVVAFAPAEVHFWDNDNSASGRPRLLRRWVPVLLRGPAAELVGARPFPYTRYQQSLDPTQPFGLRFDPVEVESRGSRMDFYIVYDF
jgi:hypothetical protein